MSEYVDENEMSFLHVLSVRVTRELGTKKTRVDDVL